MKARPAVAATMDVRRVPVSRPHVPAGETNAYVLGRDPGLLVDPGGAGDPLPSLIRERGVDRVLATHAHPDHVAGLVDLADPLDLSVVCLAGHGASLREATGVTPDRAVRPGETLRVGDDRCDVLATPGHAPDHLSLECPDGAIVCGDCAIAAGSVAVGHPAGDMRAYLGTLRRLWARDPATLLPGHGPPIAEPRGTLERLISHRLERERRVEAAVRAGAETPDGITDRAYDRELGRRRRLARATVVAHLEKLAVEGRLSWDGDRAVDPNEAAD